MFNLDTLNQVDFNSPVTSVLTFSAAKNPTPQPLTSWWSRPTDPVTAWTSPTSVLWTLNGVPMDGTAAFGGRQIGVTTWSRVVEP